MSSGGELRETEWELSEDFRRGQQRERIGGNACGQASPRRRVFSREQVRLLGGFFEGVMASYCECTWRRDSSV